MNSAHCSKCVCTWSVCAQPPVVRIAICGEWGGAESRGNGARPVE